MKAATVGITADAVLLLAGVSDDSILGLGDAHGGH
jgi:hypothetical protein